MRSLRYLPSAVCAWLAPVPAFAAGAAVLPEPSSLALLGIGIAGVILGRHLSSRKPRD
ncbi:hypothetical protein GCM10011494_11890 [Novosphingobium endophyticum]|uniref:Ice-binding protein C-terminal domain-containing protein n=1 Tax=Novosphingobium endophyticum TaxID=1955250 RepID=A0A916TRG5_9SPHN|nr:PEP-CTERM sorting domain-containing protein [Novosphingobium endophyticum]GGB95062.1 hypothetical protein GCM10011494_11890 [Novosphingobium endophyticum]